MSENNKIRQEEVMLKACFYSENPYRNFSSFTTLLLTGLFSAFERELLFQWLTEERQSGMNGEHSSEMSRLQIRGMVLTMFLPPAVSDLHSLHPTQRTFLCISLLW